MRSISRSIENGVDRALECLEIVGTLSTGALILAGAVVYINDDASGYTTSDTTEMELDHDQTVTDQMETVIFGADTLICDGISVPANLREKRNDIVDLWGTKGFDLSSTEVVYATHDDRGGCEAELSRGPSYNFLEDKIFMSNELPSMFSSGTDECTEVCQFVVLSHEFGHSLQNKYDEHSSYEYSEQQADCYAGVVVSGIQPDYIDEGISLMLESGNPGRISIHGTPNIRVNAFLMGVDSGVCDIDDISALVRDNNLELEYEISKKIVTIIDVES